MLNYAPDQPAFDATTFSKNRRVTVDGTLLKAWASHKRTQWHGEKRKNDTHASTTVRRSRNDAAAAPERQGTEADNATGPGSR
jgi:hypothetical protein